MINIGNYPFKSFDLEYSNLGGNEEEIIEFGTIQEYLFPVNTPVSIPAYDLFQFSITFRLGSGELLRGSSDNLQIIVLNIDNFVIYEPEINTDVLINTFTWQLPTETSYKIILRNLGNESISYKYSLFSQKKATELKGYINHNRGDLFPYSEESKNQNQLGIINPISGEKINKVSYYSPDGVNISELFRDEFVLTTLDGYYPTDTYELNISEPDYYEVGILLYLYPKNITPDSFLISLTVFNELRTQSELGTKTTQNSSLSTPYSYEIVYQPQLDLTKSGYFQHFTWYLSTGKYTINFQLLNPDLEKSCNINLYIRKGGIPTNEGNQSHYPEWNFLENRAIADFRDFSKLPPKGETLLAYKNYQISPIYSQGVNYLEETGKYIDFTINEETASVAISRVFAEETSGYIHYKNGVEIIRKDQIYPFYYQLIKQTSEVRSQKSEVRNTTSYSYEVVMEGEYDNEFADCVWCKKGNYRLIITNFPQDSHSVDFTYRSLGIEQLGSLTNDIEIKEFLFTEAYNDSFYISKLFQFELTVNKVIKIEIELKRNDYERTKNFDDLKGFQVEIRTLTGDVVKLEEKLISEGVENNGIITLSYEEIELGDRLSPALHDGGYYLMVIGRFEFVTIPGNKATFYPFKLNLKV
jgi:hypothetical protein